MKVILIIYIIVFKYYKHITIMILNNSLLILI